MKSDPEYAVTGVPKKQGLYDPAYERDACGVGFVVNIKGVRSNAIVHQALTVLVNLNHRGASGAEANTGDGAGILVQTPDTFLRKIAAPLGIALPPAGQYGTGLVFLPRLVAERDELRLLVERIVTEEDQAPRRRYRARPGLARPRHRVLPLPIAGLWIVSTQEKLPDLARLRPGATARKILLRLGLLRGAGVDVALLQRHHVEQPRRRIERR